MERLGGIALSVAAALREMVKALASHFGPIRVENSTAQLSARTQKRTESLTEFGHGVKKLAKLS